MFKLAQTEYEILNGQMLNRDAMANHTRILLKTMTVSTGIILALVALKLIF